MAISEADQEAFILKMDAIEGRLRLKHGDEVMKYARAAVSSMFITTAMNTPPGIHPGEIMTVAAEIISAITHYNDEYQKHRNN